MADWLPELSDDDLDTLMDALEAWESKDQAGEMFDDVVSHILAAGSKETAAQLAQQRAPEKLSRQRAKTQRKERSVLLRAKLLTLRDRRRVERVIS